MSLADSLAVESRSRILLVVVDGLGGLPLRSRTELESAAAPNLDRLASESALGLLIPVEPGITPGSGPAHLALFGYDPVEYQVGRGVVEALGVGFDIAPGDLCGRANFATVGPDGLLTDRRAGRLATDESAALCRRLQEQVSRIEDVEVVVRPGKEHRFVVVFRGPGLEEGLSDSDPQHDGFAAAEVRALAPGASKSARIANEFVARCAELLGAEKRANCVLLRGLARRPVMPSFGERFRLRAACVAAYPMYRGLARLVGMDVLETSEDWDEEVGTVRQAMGEYDFFYLHFKETDKAGEDGDFDTKVELVERFDEDVLPALVSLGFDVVCITGDHSTPAVMHGHSWHPVPALVWSRYTRPQFRADSFGERACAQGSLGTIYSRQLMTMLLAHALRLRKFGA